MSFPSNVQISKMMSFPVATILRINCHFDRILITSGYVFLVTSGFWFKCTFINTRVSACSSCLCCFFFFYFEVVLHIIKDQKIEAGLFLFSSWRFLSASHWLAFIHFGSSRPRNEWPAKMKTPNDQKCGKEGFDTKISSRKNCYHTGSFFQFYHHFWFNLTAPPNINSCLLNIFFFVYTTPQAA